MLARLVWTLLLAASVGTLLGVGVFFYLEYDLLAERQRTVVDLKATARDEGPCAALLAGTATRKLPEADFDLKRNIDVLRQVFAAAVVGAEEDRRGQKALIAAADDGLLSLTLCEQIKMSADIGEAHPVLALLRFTRERDPCEEALALDQVISGLGSHRSLLLRGLVEDVGKLRCLTPAMAQEVAQQVVNMLHDDAQAFDDLDVLRIANFLSTWAPMAAAQTGCGIEALGHISRLGNAIGCTPYQRDRVLGHYRYLRPIPAGSGAPALAAGQEVFLLWREGKRCELRPMADPPRVLSVACGDLELISELEIAVAIERVEFGLARADLISGLARYSGRTRVTVASTQEPEARSWFAYNRSGQALGVTQVTDLQAIARHSQQEIPDNPLRTFCHESGAKFCYDVDWTQLVEKLAGTPVVFLSRPLDVFLREAVVPAQMRQRLLEEALGEAPKGDAVARIYNLGEGSQLVVESRPGGVQVRWRVNGNGSWRAQSFGAGEGGAVPPAARLVAAMDLQGDGRPELVIQRAERRDQGGAISDVTDEIHLVHLDVGGDRFVTLTQLTVHEY